MRKLLAVSFLVLAIAGCQKTKDSEKSVMDAAKGDPAKAAPASALSSLTKEQQDAVRILVRDTLVSNPDILLEAQQAYEAKQIRAQNETVAKSWDKLIKEDAQISFGPQNAKVTIIEFFDYKCGPCHAAMPWVAETMKKHPEYRFIFKEFPILTPQSRIAAKAAMAAHTQGKYRELHFALMQARGELNQDQIMQIASSVGIDTAKLTKEMAKPEYENRLTKIQAQAQEVGVNGTPGFIVNGKLIAGFSQQELESAIGTSLGQPATP